MISTPSSRTFRCPSRPARRATSWRAGSGRYGAGRTGPPPDTNPPPKRKDTTVTVNVGVIGLGMIGQEHIRRLTHVLAGARVAAVTDVDLDRAKAVAEGPQARVHACIAADKQVFCEKPLATTREACERIVDAEAAAGHRLLMVGFMRRYDDG